MLMLMREIIRKKRDGEALTDAEIAFFIRGYLNGKIRDFEASALLMAICFQGMDERETLTLTLEMARSGEQLDLSSLSGVAADKHSTGGVGDKTTLINLLVSTSTKAGVATLFSKASLITAKFNDLSLTSITSPTFTMYDGISVLTPFTKK